MIEYVVGEMSKAMLQKTAQPLSDTSMFKPLPGSYYSGWSCVGQLIAKQLVQRLGNPHRLVSSKMIYARQLLIIWFRLSLLGIVLQSFTLSDLSGKPS